MQLKLKENRTKKKLTIPALSKLSGVPKRTIEDIERFYTCKIATARLLCDALNIMLDEFCPSKNKGE